MKQMRRAVSIALVLTMILSMFSINFITANAAGPDFDPAAPLLGDADMDGRVTIYDASYLQKSLAHMSGYPNYQAIEAAGETDRVEHKVADVDKDGKITIYDVSMIQKWLAASQADKDASDIGKPIAIPQPPTEPPTQAPETDEPTQAPDTQEPDTQEPETDEPTQEPDTQSGEIVDGYYLVGTLNGEDCWGDNLSADRLFKENPGAAGEYMLDWYFYDGDEIKAAKVENGEVTAWYNPDGENYKITEAGGKTGDRTVYFNPDGNPEWSYVYLTVQPRNPDQPTDSPETQSGEITDGYYLVGTLNGENCWQDNITADRMLKANPGAEGEYMLDWTFYDGDEIKAVKVENGEITKWYNDTMDDNYVLTDEGGKTGECTVYFRPEGNSDWSYFYLTVQKKAAPSTDATTAPSTDVTTAPSTDTTTSTEAPATLTDGYYLVGIINGVATWEAKAENKLSANEGAEGEYQIDKTFKNNDAIKVVKVENGEITKWYNDTVNAPSTSVRQVIPTGPTPI